MTDDKKSKGRSPSGKVKKGKVKAAASEGKKLAVRENGADVTGNIVLLADQKKAKSTQDVKDKAVKAKVKSPETAKEKSTTLISSNTMEKKMSKANTANTANPFDKISNETMNFSKDCSEACAKSGQIFMKGFEDIIGAVVSLVQTSAEKNAKFVKEAMSSKTINEFAEVQTKMAQSSFDDFMSGATKISELSVKILSEGSEPVNAHITKAVQKATESMAA